MKKIVTILLTVLVVATAIGIFAMNSFALTQNDGWYEIATAEDLIEFRNTATNGAKAKLTADIDMSGKEWTPFGSIVLTLDGQGHTISGITVNNTNGTSTDNGTAFGLLANTISNGPGNSTITNLVFEDCSLTVTMNGGKNFVGIVAGFANRGAAYGITLKNCDITVKGTADNIRCGFILGETKWSHGGCKFADGSEATMVGGIVNADCSITVANDASITGAKYFGGITGTGDATGIIILGSEFYGTISAPEGARIGAFVADVWNKVGLYNCKLEGNTAGLSLGVYVANGFEYGASTPEGYNYLVERINTKNAGQGFYLYGDIDFTGKEFKPITVNYKGTIDGRNHTISNVSVTYNDQTGGDYAIIANRLVNSPNGTVKNLTLKNATLTVTLKEGENVDVRVGAIVGSTDRGVVTDVILQNVDILVSGNNSGGNVQLGGAIGKADYSANGGIGCWNVTADKDCSVTAAANGYCDVGGIVGKVGSNWGDEYVVIDGCTNYGTVKSAHIAGGILGWYSCGNANNVIKNCKNYGNIISTGEGAAAIVWGGEREMTISDCTAGGFVIANNAQAVTNRAEIVQTNIKNVAILNPLTGSSDKNLVGYFQKTAPDAEGKVDLRVLFLVKTEYLETVDALKTGMTFTKEGADVKSFNPEFSKTVFKQITADGDVFTSPEGIVIYGYIIRDIPVAEADAFTVTVTDGQSAEIFSGSGAIN